MLDMSSRKYMIIFMEFQLIIRSKVPFKEFEGDYDIDELRT
jgi:hypothetical protein